MNDLFEKIVSYKQKGIDMVLVTVVEKTGEGPVDIGKKMLVTADGQAFGTVGGGALERFARDKCPEIIKSRAHLTEKYLLNQGKVMAQATTLPMACGGTATLFYEFLGPRNYVYIFGAGHCGAALVPILKTLNFHVTVIDEREEVIDRLNGADIKVHSPFADYIKQNGLRDDSLVVVCTPSHLHDYHVLNQILEQKLKPRYVGMLCSTKKIKDYLDVTYKTYGKDIDLSNFYSPIGLELGGDTPEDIAISIASEMLAVQNKIVGQKHMREKIDGNYRYW